MEPSLCFCTKGIFRMVPKGLNAFESSVHAAEIASYPEGFALLLGQCTALRSLAQLTTPF